MTMDDELAPFTIRITADKLWEDLEMDTKTATPKQPMQPMYLDPHGYVRFLRNSVVGLLLDKGGIDLNRLASEHQLGKFGVDDWCQFMQLIGYSLRGYHELSDVPDSYALAASKTADDIGLDGNQGCRTDGCPLHCGVGDDGVMAQEVEESEP